MFHASYPKCCYVRGDLYWNLTKWLCLKSEDKIMLSEFEIFSDFFSGACDWRSTPKRPMMLGRKGNKINEKGGGRAAAEGKTQPSAIWTNNECGTMRKPKISHCLLSHYGQKRTRTPFTGRRLSSSGNRSGVSSSSSTQPLRHWTDFVHKIPAKFFVT